jgi:hypothetical protein
MPEVKRWYLPFRQTGGSWVAWGQFGYKTYQDALAAGDVAKQPDAEVGAPFEANSKAEADEMANKIMVGCRL